MSGSGRYTVIIEKNQLPQTAQYLRTRAGLI